VGLNRNGGACMANDKHVALLKQGVKSWNAWRVENPGNLPLSADLGPHSIAALVATGRGREDLSGANLSGWGFPDLSGANLSEANLRGVDLNFADLSGANPSGANLSGASLSGAS
jgi:Pentapeptide repeats (8 copies)